MNHKKKLKSFLRNLFGYKSYINDLQEQAVETIWEAKRDVFLRGFGKSLCYQLPILTKDNSFIIIISCRTTYIKDQTNYLTSKQIVTHYLNSDTSRKRRQLIENDITSQVSKMKMLFITPFQYESGYFKTILKKIPSKRLSYIVIDVADNIISKHSNLRSHYQNLDLKIIRVPIVTLSATATEKIQRDTIKEFGLRNPIIYSMPVVRTNLYHDVWFTNLLLDPTLHLKNFIKNCLHLDNFTKSDEEESCGIIFCKNLEATKSIAKILIYMGIPTQSYDTCSKNGSSFKNKNIQKFNNVKVITVCIEDDILTVTNSLIKMISGKLIRFITYWHVLPSVIKYYLESSRAQSFHGISYCRVYCQLEELINESSQFCHKEIDKSSTVITSSLTKVQCRHKVYSDFFGDTLFACKNCCDVCTDKHKVEERLVLLLDNIDNENIKKLQEKFPEFLKYFERNSKQNHQGKYLKQTHSCDNEIKSNQNVEKKCENSTFDENIESDEVNFIEISTKYDKQLKAVSALNEIYKNLFPKKGAQSSTLCPSRSSNDTTEQKKLENSNFLKKNSDNTDKISDCRLKETGSNAISRDDRYLSNKKIYYNDRLNRIKKNHKFNKRKIDIVTIEDDVCQRKECSVEDKSNQIKTFCNSDNGEDDIIFIEEIKSTNKKRRCSIEEDSAITKSKETKRRKKIDKN